MLQGCVGVTLYITLCVGVALDICTLSAKLTQPARILPKQGPVTYTPKALPTFTYRIGEMSYSS